MVRANALSSTRIPVVKNDSGTWDCIAPRSQTNACRIQIRGVLFIGE